MVQKRPSTVEFQSQDSNHPQIYDDSLFGEEKREEKCK